MPDEDQVKFVLRLTPGMHKKIKRSAKSNNTSMNKEITNIIAETFSKTSTDKKLGEIISILERKKVS
jgi:hypothetical protein